MHTAREGQFGDQQRHREADPGEEPDREKIADADPVGQAERGDLRDQRRDAENADQLADHERDHDRDGDRIRERAQRAGVARERDPGCEEREDRQRDTGRQRPHDVLDLLRARRCSPWIGRAGTQKPSSTPAMVACTPDSCMNTQASAASGTSTHQRIDRIRTASANTATTATAPSSAQKLTPSV